MTMNTPIVWVVADYAPGVKEPNVMAILPNRELVDKVVPEILKHVEEGHELRLQKLKGTMNCLSMLWL